MAATHTQSPRSRLNYPSFLVARRRLYFAGDASPWTSNHAKRVPRRRTRSAPTHPRTPYRRTITPLRKRRSSISSSSSCTPSGKNRFPPPTKIGQTIIRNPSTRPARTACAASSGRRLVMSSSASALRRRTASASNSRSIRRPFTARLGEGPRVDDLLRRLPPPGKLEQVVVVDREAGPQSPNRPSSRISSVRREWC